MWMAEKVCKIRWWKSPYPSRPDIIRWHGITVTVGPMARMWSTSSLSLLPQARFLLQKCNDRKQALLRRRRKERAKRRNSTLVLALQYFLKIMSGSFKPHARFKNCQDLMAVKAMATLGSPLFFWSIFRFTWPVLYNVPLNRVEFRLRNSTITRGGIGHFWVTFSCVVVIKNFRVNLRPVAMEKKGKEQKLTQEEQYIFRFPPPLAEKMRMMLKSGQIDNVSLVMGGTLF